MKKVELGVSFSGKITGFKGAGKRVAFVNSAELGCTTTALLSVEQAATVAVGDYVTCMPSEYQAVEKVWDAAANNGAGAFVNKRDEHNQFIPTGEMISRNDVINVGTKAEIASSALGGEELTIEINNQRTALLNGAAPTAAKKRDETPAVVEDGIVLAK